MAGPVARERKGQTKLPANLYRRKVGGVNIEKKGGGAQKSQAKNPAKSGKNRADVKKLGMNTFKFGNL